MKMRRCPVNCPMYNYAERRCMQCGRYVRFLDVCAARRIDQRLAEKSLTNRK